MRTEIWTGTKTDLGDAFAKHSEAYRINDRYAVGRLERGWLDAIRSRATRLNDATLRGLTDQMMRLLKDPQAIGSDFKDRMQSAFDSSRELAYPLSTRYLKEIHSYSGVSLEYTLSCMDLGWIRRLEDEAVADLTMRSFVKEMTHHFENKAGRPKTEAYRQAFDAYSEGLICQLLRDKVGERLTITKMDASKSSAPDFHCILSPEKKGGKQLEFYIEVKSLDLADASHRLKEMLDEQLATQLSLEDQLKNGAKIAMAESEIAPNRGVGGDPAYDPWSVGKNIEFIAQKASSNFKNKQFSLGPTFALVNLLRVNIMGQGLGALAPVFYDDYGGGGCESGILWNAAFGATGDPVYRRPQMEGKGDVEGRLLRDGVLVDPSLNLDAAGIIFLHDDQGYKFDGLYDAKWTHAGANWSNTHVENALYALCHEYNDRRNEFAFKYSRFRRRGP